MFALWNWNISTKFSFTQKCLTLKERCSLVYRDHGTSGGHCQVEPTGQGSLEYISWSSVAMSSMAICNLLLTVIWPAISSFPQRCQSLNRCKTLFNHKISHGARKNSKCVIYEMMLFHVDALIDSLWCLYETYHEADLETPIWQLTRHFPLFFRADSM